ncbi:MAG TPA: flagellar hook capping FlgD N-terminal domain-containing protein [Actinoplanes sp.]|nr:flagellar hook capping FlgD N-terminal domain-containing protein [Actinoplanes sp.]
MTSPIGNTPVGSLPTGKPNTPAVTSLTTGNATGPKSTELDQDTFLKLLVAQLKYQDPSNPADSTQFLAQTAQFTQVEKLGQIADAQASMLSAQLMAGASNLVGRTVTYLDAAGAEQTGVVKSATLGGSDPTLRVGFTDVQLSKVKEVRETA